MIKSYPVVKEQKSRDVRQIEWSDKYGAYLLTSGGKIIEIISIDQDELFRLKAGERKSLYPNFKENQYIELHHFSGRFPADESDIYSANVLEYKDSVDLPYGVYKMKTNHYGETLFVPFKSNLKESNLIVPNKDLPKYVTDFFTEASNGMRKNKMGMLLFGPPGNGKTTSVMSLFSICEELKMRIYLIDTNFKLSSFSEAKPALETSKSIFVIEEITERLRRQDLEEVLTFLDGEESWDNSITMATTNHPEDMPPNLIDRPGRFETFIEYGLPTYDQILQIVVMAGLPEEEALAFKGQGLSFDYVSFIVSKSVNENVSTKDMMAIETKKREKISVTFKGKIGLR